MRQGVDWLKLDNAGIIFPSTSTRRKTDVFRFSCQLHEEVDPALLQQALDGAVREFPHFLCVLRRGLFWYYLESSELRPRVAPTDWRACAPLWSPNRRSLLFSLTYYKKRVSLEVYHVLADGTGAIHFFKAILRHYLLLRHFDTLGGQAPALDYRAPFDERTEDGFRKHYRRIRAPKSDLPRHPWRLRGPRGAEYQLIEGAVSCAEALQLARRHGTSLTVLLTAVLIEAIHDQMPRNQSTRPIVVTIPVNLRKHFPSETARNFFGIVRVAYRFGQGEDTLDCIIDAVDKGLKEELREEKLARRIGALMALERNPVIKIIPLFLKNPVLRLSKWISDRGSTMTLSNVGAISLPPDLQSYVDLFSVYSSTGGMQVCVCSTGDRLTCGFASLFNGTELQRSFFSRLAGLGLSPVIYTNIEE